LIKVTKNGKTYYGIKALRVIPKRNIILSKESIDFLNGELLGDGNISFNRIRYWSKHKSYVEWLSKTLASFGGEYIAYQYTSKSYDALEQLCNKWYLQDFSFCPSCNIIFHDQTVQRNQWIKRKHCPVCNEHLLFKKIVPKDIELTPITLMQWFIGDGTNETGYGGKSVTFCCQAFPSRNKTILKNKLKKIGIYTKGEKVIHLEKKSVCDFFRYIGNCPVKCYRYKFRKPIG